MDIKISQGKKPQIYTQGEIVKYIRFRKGELPPKYFKCKKINMEWGVVDYGKGTIGLAYITKTNFFEKVIFYLFHF